MHSAPVDPLGYRLVAIVAKVQADENRTPTYCPELRRRKIETAVAALMMPSDRFAGQSLKCDDNDAWNDEPSASASPP
jgi:hypothetical protein